MNECVPQRHFFYQQCAERSPRVAAALGLAGYLLPPQGARNCKLMSRTAIVETMTMPVPGGVHVRNVSRTPNGYSMTYELPLEDLVFYALRQCDIGFGELNVA